MFKRLICMLMSVVLFLSCAGCAAVYATAQVPGKPSETAVAPEKTLRERLGVPETIQGSFVSESGISRVSVDAAILVPEVSQVDVIQALPRVYTNEEIVRFFKRHRGEMEWRYAESGEPYLGGLPSPNACVDGVNLYHLWADVSRESSPDGKYKSFTVDYGQNADTGALGFMAMLGYYEDFDLLPGVDLVPLQNDKAKDCTISLEEAVALADAEVQALAPDYTMIACGQTPEYELGCKEQFYSFRYTRNLQGIPVNYSYGSEQVLNPYGYTAGLSVISVVVSDDGVQALEYGNPCDVGQTIEENVELLPFEDIWDIFENVALMTIQHLEVDPELETNELDVYEVRFGYMAVLQGDGTYRYTPVWDFYGHHALSGSGGYAHSDEQPPVEGEVALTIHAVDGTILDRTLGH